MRASSPTVSAWVCRASVVSDHGAQRRIRHHERRQCDVRRRGDAGGHAVYSRTRGPYRHGSLSHRLLQRSCGSLIGFRATNDLALWFVLRFAMNSALQGLFLVSEVWINQIATDAMRGRLIAIYASLVSAGFAIGPIIIQFLGTTGWAPFIAGGDDAVGNCPRSLPRAALPDPAPSRTRKRARHVELPLLPHPPPQQRASPAECAGDLRRLFLTIYAVRLGSNEAAPAFLITAWDLGNMLLVPPLGWLADKSDRRFVLILCGGVGLIGAEHFCPHGRRRLVGADLGFASGEALLRRSTRSASAALARPLSGQPTGHREFGIPGLYALGTLAGPGLGGIAIDAWNPHGFADVLGLISGLFAAVVPYRAATFPRPVTPPPRLDLGTRMTRLSRSEHDPCAP